MLARSVDFKARYGLAEAGPNTFGLPPSDVCRKLGAVGVPLFNVEVRLKGCGDEGELLIIGPHVLRRLLAPARGERAPRCSKAVGCSAHLRPRPARRRRGFRIIRRVKDRIISGGKNSYPAGIETFLSGLAEIVEVCVIGVPDSKWGETPRALVVRRPGSALSSGNLLV